MTGLATVAFSRWELVAGVAALVIVGAVLAVVIIGRALRWKAELRDAERRK